MAIFNKKIKKNRGMSYVELIVVLSIFSVLSSVALFNYGGFQSKVDIKNLSADIALKIVEAQKASLSGKLPPAAQQSHIDGTWKPSYGVYLNTTLDNKSFVYFTDLGLSDGATPPHNLQNSQYSSSSCPGSGECLDKITITKGNSISRLDVFYQGDTTPHLFTDLTISFRRPNSAAVIKSTSAFTGPVSYIQITITSPKSYISKIKVYPSGRIQVN